MTASTAGAPIDGQSDHAPIVSVLMTVYNGEDYLRQTIESVLEQTLTELELLVIDDGSEDGTAAIVEEMAAVDGRILFFPFPRTAHRAQMLNYLVERSSGDYVAILDADDAAYPDRLEKQVAYLRAHPAVGLVGGASLRINETTGNEYVVTPPLTDEAIRASLIRGFPIVHSTIMVPGAVIRSIGGYNEAYALSEDYELYFRIASQYELACLPDVLIRKRDSGFFAQKSIWQRQRLVMKIRQYGWRSLSRPLSELYYVWADPPVNTAYRVLRNAFR